MREIECKDKNFKHKVFIDSNPLFSLMPKQEWELFVATVELEARDYYKDKKQTQDGNKFGQPP